MLRQSSGKCCDRCAASCLRFWKDKSSKVWDWLMILGLALCDEFLPDLIKLHLQCIPYEDGSNDNPCSTDLNGRDAEINYPFLNDTVKVSTLEMIAFTSFVLIFTLNIFIAKIFDKNCIVPLFSHAMRSYDKKNKKNKMKSEETQSNNNEVNDESINTMIKHKQYHVKFHFLAHFRMILSKFECFFRMCCVSIFVTSILTGIIKETVGRPRPDFYNYNVIDPIHSRMAFPSGHTSFSFSIFFLETLFLYNSLMVARSIKFYGIDFVNNNSKAMHQDNATAMEIKQKSLEMSPVSMIGAEIIIDDRNKSKASVMSMNDETDTEFIVNGKDEEFGSMYNNIQKQTFINYLINSNQKSIYTKSNALATIVGNETNDNVDIGTMYYLLGSQSMYTNGNIYFGLILWYYLRNNIIFSTILAFFPTLFAIYVGCSRITDYRHRVGDVIAGALLGGGIAYLTFKVFSFEFYGNPKNDRDKTLHDKSFWNNGTTSDNNNNNNNKDNEQGGIMGHLSIANDEAYDKAERLDDNEYDFKAYQSTSQMGDRNLITPHGATKIKQNVGYAELVSIRNPNDTSQIENDSDDDGN